MKIIPQVVLLDGSLTTFKGPYALTAVLIYAVAAQDGIAAFADGNARSGVGVDLVLFENSKTTIVNRYSCCPAVMDAVATKPWI
jgi:hypothetical protein